MFYTVGQKHKLYILSLGKIFYLRVNQLSYSIFVHRITTDQLPLEGRLSNEWTVAAFAETDFFVLLLNPTF
jgi:hypothetical protein